MTLATWAEAISRQRLADALPNRWAHVQSVAVEARRITAAVDKDDADLLVAAAVLHDVGYAPTLVERGFHPLDGARFLRELGASGRLCALVANHSNARREARMRHLDSLLAEFEDEATPVRDALWYCDMVTGPTGIRVTFDERIAEIQHRYGPNHLVSQFIRAAHDELLGAVERTQARMTAASVVHAT